MLSRSSAEIWVYKRDPSITMPMRQALWERDGVRYLCPELQLLHKAKAVRPKDQADFDAAIPLLDGDRRAWLRDAIARVRPDHPWLGRLA